MGFGVSVYTTGDFTLSGNIEYIKMAGEYGIGMAFTSMHLPEVSYLEKLKEIYELMENIKMCQMKLTVDISPAALKVMDASIDNLLPLYNIGVDCLRLDYGFAPREIAAMSNNSYGMEIELNASTISKEQIEQLTGLGVNLNNLRACHNFYPRPYTGLSYEFFMEKTRMIKHYGLKLGAFIPSNSGRRGPLYEGLPTLEIHRNIGSSTAARHLLYTGLVDDVYFGDAYASKNELKTVTTIDPNVIEMDIVLKEGLTDNEKTVIFADVHTNRPDASEYIIRSEESRGYAQIGKEIMPKNCISRKKYSVTIDNARFKRYSGELQICMADLPADDRVNVVGYVPEGEHLLAGMIRPGFKFRFRRRLNL